MEKEGIISKKKVELINYIKNDSIKKFIELFNLEDYIELLNFNEKKKCLGNLEKRNLFEIAKRKKLKIEISEKNIIQLKEIYIKILNHDYIPGFSYEDFINPKQKNIISEIKDESLDIEEPTEEIVEVDFSDILF